jgi:hypothetical protein
MNGASRFNGNNDSMMGVSGDPFVLFWAKASVAMVAEASV